MAKVVVREVLAEDALELVDAEQTARQVAGTEEVLELRRSEEAGRVQAERRVVFATPGEAIRVEQDIERDALAVRRADERAGRRADEDVEADAQLLTRLEDAEVGDAARGAAGADERDAGGTATGLRTFRGVVGRDGSQYDTTTMPAALDPDAVRALGRTMKNELRKSMLMKRTMTPRDVRGEASRAIAERLTALAAWKEAKSVALFRTLVAKGEVDTAYLDHAAREAGKRVAYPAIEGDGSIEESTMVFRWVDDPAVLTARGRGFAEPGPEAERAEVIDLIVVPGLAFDPAGHRVGYGAALYDKTLPRYSAVTVGVAFDFQLVMELPVSEQDVAVSTVVTDKRVIVP